LEKEKLLYSLISILSVAFLIALVVILMIRQRWLQSKAQATIVQSALKASTDERKQVARDLHDGLGGMLSVVKLQLKDAETLQNARESLEVSIEELRRIAHHLMPSSLLREGLKTSLSDFCLSLPNVQFSYTGKESKLDDSIAILIYRCTYELVNNAYKYSGAETIDVQLFQEKHRIYLSVEDDGRGFDMNTQEMGMGIENLYDRVRALKGDITITSSPGKGTQVYIEIKIKNKKI
jgi:signal transduction histidine kinase